MSARQNIKKVGTDITNVPVSKLPKNLSRVGYVVINCYLGTRYSLGDGPMNDGYHMAKCLKQFGFQVYYVLDSKKQAFMDKLDYFLENTKRELVVYYVGHGTYQPDLNGDEDDGSDECLVFVDGNAVDDDLIASVCQSKHNDSKVVFVSDCCHSGSIWDLQDDGEKGIHFPENMISVSASNDKQTAKQTVADRQEQGMFTYNLMKLLKVEPDLTAVQCKSKLASVLRRYAQTVTIATTTPALLHEPLFLMQ